LFTQVGEVTEVFLPVDRATGRPRGFAFVEFSDHASISQAVTKFDGTEFQGRPLKVNEARERAPRPPGFGGGGGFGFNSEMGADAPPKSSRPKGSRRGIRGKKRGFS
jgi:cold-inducible RNA-binding protein